eukprot:5196556-Prymnesium_polylepis.1
MGMGQSMLNGETQGARLGIEARVSRYGWIPVGTPVFYKSSSRPVQQYTRQHYSENASHGETCISPFPQTIPAKSHNKPMLTSAQTRFVLARPQALQDGQQDLQTEEGGHVLHDSGGRRGIGGKVWVAAAPRLCCYEGGGSDKAVCAR